jgi:hypothetical protein
MGDRKRGVVAEIGLNWFASCGWICFFQFGDYYLVLRSFTGFSYFYALCKTARRKHFEILDIQTYIQQIPLYKLSTLPNSTVLILETSVVTGLLLHFQRLCNCLLFGIE